MSERGLYLAWMPRSRRAETIARALGLRLVLWPRPGRGRRWTAPLAYAWLALRSAWLIARERPRAVIVVAPPFVAPLVVVPLVRTLGGRVAVDIHSAGLLEPVWRPTMPLLRWACRLADVAIVTLPSLGRRLGDEVDTLVMPDPLPSLPVPDARAADVDRTLPEVVAVAGWARDEPIEALIEAARGRDFHLSITGRPDRPLDLPSNVTLTGFLPEPDYAARLASADLVVALTTRDETLLCAAWEALSVRRPVALSDTAAQRSTFGDGLVYVRPDATSIGEGIERALASGDPAGIDRLERRFRRMGDENLARLAEILA